jgi:Ca-activated chloride channel family protein
MSARSKKRSRHAATILLDGPAPANRDFELTWTAKPLAKPAAALFREEIDGEDYLLAFVTPPQAAEMTEAPQPREVIFVQDVSGSMGGTSIEQAREALEMAVKRLRSEDRFNIITFSSDFDMFHRAPVQATPGAVADAVRRIRALEAGGGTEMAPALSLALQDTSPDRSTLRQIVFLTDGAVGNEAFLFTLIDRALGRSRLFTVGIGSAPNSYFMTRAAEMGRGAHVTISDLSQVRERMADLFAKIETPAMTNLTATWPDDMKAEFWPNPLPDLYAGEPVALAVKSPDASGTLTLSGDRGDERWTVSLPLDKAGSREGIGKLWARSKIRALEGLRNKAGTTTAQQELADDELLQTALTHSLVSRRTSLVAVDVEVSRPEGVEVASVKVPLNLPAGWDAALFFDEQDNTPRPPATRKAAIDAPDVMQAQAFAPVPRGALDWESAMLRGFLLMVLGGALLIVARRRV